MTPRVETHIRLGTRTVSPSDQSEKKEETLGPYLPIAKFRENPRRNKRFLFFSAKIYFAQGVFRGETRKMSFFLG